MNKLIGIFFAIACIATSAVSNSMMGAGPWFWVIIATGIAVAVSQFFPTLRGAGSGLALMLATLSVCAVLLGLLAATTGGSFNMGDGAGILLFFFFIIALLGFVLSGLYKRSLRAVDDGSDNIGDQG